MIPLIAHIPCYRGPSFSQYTPTNHTIPQTLSSVSNLTPKFSNMIFLHILLAIQPVIAAYQHHINSSIQCPDVSFCPFKPATTTLCLHFSIKSSILIPPALSPSHLFILLLLAGDINPNPGAPKCLKVSYTTIRSINNKYPAIAKFISDNDTDFFAMSET